MWVYKDQYMEETCMQFIDIVRENTKLSYSSIIVSLLKQNKNI